MDPSLYRTLKTSRGLNYRYWYQPARSEAHTTILLLHGFPSTSWDWHKVVTRLQPKGYGLVVPDLLGYGGTDKPLEPELYSHFLMAKDLDEILEKEGLAKVVVLGHDWGSVMTSRFYNYQSQRVLALGFVAAAYYMHRHSFDCEMVSKMTEEAFGYSTMGYWFFLAQEDSHKVIKEHIDSFASIIFSHDPERWKTQMGPVGSLEARITSDEVTPRVHYLSEEEYKRIKEGWATDGLAGAVNWYRSMITGVNTKDAKPIPEELLSVNVPVYFFAAAKDFNCREDRSKETISQTCKHPETVVRTYDGDHWIIFSHANEIADDFDAWIEGLKSKSVL